MSDLNPVFNAQHMGILSKLSLSFIPGKMDVFFNCVEDMVMGNIDIDPSGFLSARRALWKNAALALIFAVGSYISYCRSNQPSNNKYSKIEQEESSTTLDKVVSCTGFLITLVCLYKTQASFKECSRHLDEFLRYPTFQKFCQNHAFR